MGTWQRRVAEFFALDDDWERRGGLTARDWVVGAVAFGFAILTLELARSAGALERLGQPAWLHVLVVGVGALLLIGRRRWPLTVATLAAAHMLVAGVTMPVVMGQLSLQVIYFVAFFSGVAWARSRREMCLVMGGVLVVMFGWIAWQFAVGTWIDEIRVDIEEDHGLEEIGLFGPVSATVLMAVLINLLYFGGAVLVGQVAWRGARQRDRLAEQAATIAHQAEELQRRAVTAERVRIARELHDVVAHHVSVIGIQAAAGRRVLGRDPAAVEDALGQVEESAREAVGQMRSLVGTLRDPSYDEEGADPDSRAPEPGWSDIDDLIASVHGNGVRVDHDLVERPDGSAAALPVAVGASLYRTVQEALTNVRRHSTADRVVVVLRVDRVATPPYAEVEVTDNGRPRHGTSGSGLGLLGVRERAAARRGEVEIGPRATGGFRVRVRFPLEVA